MVRLTDKAQELLPRLGELLAKQKGLAEPMNGKAAVSTLIIETVEYLEKEINHEPIH